MAKQCTMCASTERSERPCPQSSVFCSAVASSKGYRSWVRSLLACFSDSRRPALRDGYSYRFPTCGYCHTHFGFACSWTSLGRPHCQHIPLLSIRCMFSGCQAVSPGNCSENTPVDGFTTSIVSTTLAPLQSGLGLRDTREVASLPQAHP